MSSATSPVRAALEDYVAGQVKAEDVARVVVDVYYRAADGRIRTALRPVLEVVERAAPGVVELSRHDGGPGFEVRLAERPFPARFEPELKRAAGLALAGLPADGAWGTQDGNGTMGWILRRIGRWVRLGQPGRNSD